MNKILNVVADCLPLFGGLFVVTSRPAPINLEVYLAIYFLWIVSTFVWSVVCNVIQRLVPTETDTTYWSVLRVLVLLALVLFVGVLMVLLHYRAPLFTSQIILLLLLVMAVSYRFANSGKTMLATISIVLYQALACFLSFQLVLNIFDWQSLVFSIGFGLITSSLRVTQVNSKWTTGLITVGSALFALLPLTKAVSSPYLAVFGLIPLQHVVSTKNLALRALPAAAFIGMLTLLAFL